MLKQMGFQLFEVTVGMESTSFFIQLPMYHTMPVSTDQNLDLLNVYPTNLGIVIDLRRGWSSFNEPTLTI